MPSLYNEQRLAKDQVYTASKDWQRPKFTQQVKTGKGPSLRTHSEHRFLAPSSLDEGSREPVLGVWFAQ